MSAPAVVPVARFRAGDVWLAVAAKAIESVTPERQGVLHVGDVLGIEPVSERTVKTLRVGGRNGAIEFLVDGPVRIDPIGPDQLLPIPGGLPRAWMRPVLGFAGMGDDVILLLDIDSLAERLCAQLPQSEGSGE